MSESRIERKTVITYGALFTVGVAVDVVFTAATGVRESWDSGAFWSMGLPVLFAASFCAGMFGNGRPLVQGFLLAAGQFTVMMIRTGEIGSLVPLGIVVSAILGALISIGSIAGNAVKRFF